MFHGVDLSIFDTVKKRQEFRNKLREEHTKRNWHTIKRVNKKTREEENKLSDISKYDSRSEHWLGTSTVFGKEKQFLVAYTMIPKNWKTQQGLLFETKYLKSIPDNTPTEVDPDIRKIFDDDYKSSRPPIYKISGSKLIH